jgi:hypothetical protein
MAINFTDKGSKVIQFVRAPLIFWGQPRWLDQHSVGSFGQKAAGRTTMAVPCAILALLMSSFVSIGAIEAAESPEAPKPDLGAVREPPKPPNAAELETWRQKIIHAARPKATACYKANYPDTEWQEVPCVSKPRKAFLPRIAKGVHTDQVGGNSGADFSATTDNPITEAEGSFDTVTTSGASNVSSYTLQLNIAPISPVNACSGSPGTGIASLPGCQGWEQFVYSTDNGGDIATQYWLLQWGKVGDKCQTPVSASCDGSHVFTDGWCPFTLQDQAGDKFEDCAIGGSLVTGIGAVAASSLKSITINAFPADASNPVDKMTATVSGSSSNAPGINKFPELKTDWKEVEFNIFGDGNSTDATFNPNTTLEVRTSVASGTTLGPHCDFRSFTGESNNLTLVATTSNPAKSSLPSLVFTETNVGSPTTAPCSSAISLGDTHVHPFNGATEFDFQAFGDFVLAQAGPDFLVHTRQSPGPAGYPGTATNTAVAVMMGKTRICVYLQPARLVIDGVTNNLADGKTVSLPTGVQVARRGVEYRITDDNGNRVFADLVKNGSEPLWMNITVGLGRSPDKAVRGLLGNPSDKADEISTSNGLVLKVPVAVTDLYGRYADSWRVEPAKSLFVELPPAAVGAPAKPLTAEDLTPADKAHAIQVCTAKGITHEALLADCVLDTTVLKDDDAVEVFRKIAPPRVLIKPVAVRNP